MEVMLHHLEEKEIYVGMGSACSAHSKEPSKILTGIGLTPEEARCSLRISFGSQNTFADVDSLLAHADLDGVVVATNHVAHYEVARQCLEHNLHGLRGTHHSFLVVFTVEERSIFTF